MKKVKRLTALACAVLLLCLGSLTVSAEAQFVYVTEPVYSQIITGGQNGELVYAMYDKADYKIGTMDADGELTREAYSSARWDALIKDSNWKMTVIGDAADRCPYAYTHVEETVCPYRDIDLVNYTNTKTGATLSNVYVPTKSLVVFPGSGAHICWGRYGFVSPVTMKWDGESRYIALKNDEGLWGVYDADTDSMVADYAYQNMSAVSGHYAKVSDGTAWGRLDLTGATATVYRYDSEDAFSVREELRKIENDQYQVFNADNKPISTVFEGDFSKAEYAADTGLLLVTNSDKTQVLYDLDGRTVASFGTDVSVSYLQDICYAVAHYASSGSLSGVALARVDGTVAPGDVNFDGAVNSSDIRAVLCHVVGSPSLTWRGQRAADVNLDGTVDTNDAREMMEDILFVRT